jgi:hypothetical protein
MSDQVVDRPSIDEFSEVQTRSVPELLEYLNHPDTDTRALVQSLARQLSSTTQKTVAEAAVQALSTDAKQDLATSVVQDLPAEAKHDLATGVVQDLPTEAKHDLATSVVHDLPTDAKRDLATGVVQDLAGAPAAQKAVAQAAVQALPTDDAKQDLATDVVQNLGSQQKQATARAVVRTLTAEQQEELVATVLGAPDRNTQRRLWFIVVGTMGAAIFLFGLMAFVLIYQGKPAEAPLALATTALGGVVGLVVTSPVRSRG